MHASRAKAIPHRRHKDGAGSRLVGNYKRGITSPGGSTVRCFDHKRPESQTPTESTRQTLSIIQLPTNQVPLVVKLVPKIQEALGTIRSGEFVEISLED